MNIEHIAIWTKDLEGLKDFYLNHFDALVNDKYVNAAKGFESYFLSFASGARLELMYRPDLDANATPLENTVGLTHLAFSVGSTGRVDSLTDELRDLVQLGINSCPVMNAKPNCLKCCG